MNDLQLCNKGSVGGVGRGIGWNKPFEDCGITRVHDSWRFGRNISKGGKGLEKNLLNLKHQV